MLKIMYFVLRWHFLHEANGNRYHPFVSEAPIEGILGVIGPIPCVDFDIFILIRHLGSVFSIL